MLCLFFIFLKRLLGFNIVYGYFSASEHACSLIAQLQETQGNIQEDILKHTLIQSLIESSSDRLRGWQNIM